MSWLRIITATLALAALAGCSTVRLGYWQAPNLLYWWIDGHADLDEAQSARVRQDIDRFMAWHRAEELPRYAELLRRWQAMAPHDLTADAVCRQYGELHQIWERLAGQGSPALAALALQLDAAQLAHLERHQRKKQESFAKDFIQGTPEQRLRRRMDRTLGRYKDLYGNLTPAQQTLVKEGLASSPFDPEAALQERQQRDDGLRRLIGQWQAMPSDDARLARATTEAADWLRPLLPSNRDTAAPMAQVLRHGCAQYAALHNSTSPQQRAHAVQALQAYEADVRALTRQD